MLPRFELGAVQNGKRMPVLDWRNRGKYIKLNCLYDIHDNPKPNCLYDIHDMTTPPFLIMTHPLPFGSSICLSCFATATELQGGSFIRAWCPVFKIFLGIASECNAYSSRTL